MLGFHVYANPLLRQAGAVARTMLVLAAVNKRLRKMPIGAAALKQPT
jgi:hypothetical protein